MVLSLSLEALVDRRTVQQVCQQAQLRKLGQAAKLLQSVQVRSRERARRARTHTAAPRRRARAHAPERATQKHHDACTPHPTPPSRPCRAGPSPGVSYPSSRSRGAGAGAPTRREARRRAGRADRAREAVAAEPR